MWRPDDSGISAVKKGGATGKKPARLPLAASLPVRAATGSPNIVNTELLQLRAKAKSVPEDRPAYAASKTDLFRLDPKDDIYVQVYNQPEKNEVVEVTVGLELQKALELKLFEKSVDEDGKTGIIVSGEARKKIYVELGEDDVSFTKANNQGSLLFLTIQVPFAALRKNGRGRFEFEVVVNGKAYPFEVAQKSHDALGFV